MAQDNATVNLYINNKQAVESLDKIRETYQKIKKARKEAFKAGDYNKSLDLQAEEDKLLRKINEAKRGTLDIEKALANLHKINSKQLYQVRSKLLQESKLLNRDTEEYIIKRQQLAKVETEIARTTSRSAKQSKMPEWVKQGLAFTGVAAISSMLVAQTRKAYDAYAELDDKLADVMKTTGLTKEEVSGLNLELSKVDTRSSQLELLDLARQAGKLGITGVQNIEDFVIASDKIGIALGEDLGGKEEAINTMGKLVALFKLDDEFGMADGMLKIGSAINALGMASTANEGYIVDFTSRVGGISKVAKIAISDTMGIAATFDSLNANVESSATVVNKIIVGMFQNTASYADVAKMSVKDFTELLRTDANEALLTVLDGFAGADLGFTAKMLGEVGENGARAAQAVALISQNVGMVREQQQLATQEFVRGTGVIEEFNIKNNTEAALREKQIKEQQESLVELGEILSPIFRALLDGTISVTKALTAIVKIIYDYKGVLAAVATATGAYIAVQQISVAWQKLQVFWSKANRMAILKEVAAVRVGTTSTVAYTTAQKGLIAVKALMTGQWKALRIAIKATAVGVKTFIASLGPIAWAVAIVGALGVAIYKVATAQTAAEIASERYNIRLKEQQDATTDLRATTNTHIETIKSETATIYRKIEALDALKAKYPELFKNYTIEKIAMMDNLELQKMLNTETDNQIFSSKQKSYDDIIGKVEELRARLEPSSETYSSPSYTQTALINQEIEILLKDAELAKKEIEEINRLKNEALINSDPRAKELRIVSLKGNIEELDKDIAAIRKKLGDLPAPFANGGEVLTPVKRITLEYELNAHYKLKGNHQNELGLLSGNQVQSMPCGTCGKAPCECKALESAKAWTLESDKKFLEERITLKKQLLDGEIKDQEEYSKKVLALEVETLQARINSNKEKGEELSKLKEMLIDKQITQAADATKREEALLKAAQGGEDAVVKANREHTEKLQSLGLYQRDVATMTAEEKAALLAIERAHNAKISSLTMSALQKSVDEAKKSLDREMTALKIKQAEELAAARTLEQKKAILARTMSEEQRATIKTLADADKLIKAQHSAAIEEQTKKDLDKIAKLYSDTIAKITQSGSLFGNVANLTDEDRQELEDIIQKLELEMAKLTGSKPTEAGADDEKEAKTDAFGMSVDDWATLFQNTEDGLTALEKMEIAARAIGGAFSDISNLMGALEKKELNEFEKNQNKKKASLKRRLDSGAMSEDAYNKAIQNLDTETDAKREEMERKQAERQKALAIFNAIISTAVAVASILGSTPPGPWNIPLAIAVGALGAVQIATIAATPLPGAEQGGMLVEREQDGKRFNAEYSPSKRGVVSKPTVIVGENGSEYVVPAEGYSNPSIRGVLGIIEQARLSGQLRDINLPALIETNSLQGRQIGGYVSASVPSPTVPVNQPLPNPYADITPVMLGVKASLDSLNRRLANPIKADVSMHGRNGLVEQTKRYNKAVANSIIGG